MSLAGKANYNLESRPIVLPYLGVSVQGSTMGFDMQSGPGGRSWLMKGLKLPSTIIRMCMLSSMGGVPFDDWNEMRWTNEA